MGQHYIIRINRLEGIDLILKALRSTSCIASNDLADGIEKHTYVIDDEKGVIGTFEEIKQKVVTKADEVKQEKKEDKPKDRSHLQIIK